MPWSLIFNVANMSFNAIREIIILRKFPNLQYVPFEDSDQPADPHNQETLMGTL